MNLRYKRENFSPAIRGRGSQSTPDLLQLKMRCDLKPPRRTPGRIQGPHLGPASDSRICNLCRTCSRGSAGWSRHLALTCGSCALNPKLRQNKRGARAVCCTEAKPQNAQTWRATCRARVRRVCLGTTDVESGLPTQNLGDTDCVSRFGLDWESKAVYTLGTWRLPRSDLHVVTPGWFHVHLDILLHRQDGSKI